MTKELWVKAHGRFIKKYQYAGDYYLWKAFVEFERLYTVNCVLSGFRKHENPMSSDLTAYQKGQNIKQHGALYNWILRKWSAMRRVHRMRNLKVAILGASFYSWGGGIDFIMNLYRGLSYKNDTEIFLLLPRESKYLLLFKKIKRKIKGEKSPYTHTEMLGMLKAFSYERIKIRHYEIFEIGKLGIRDRGESLIKKLNKLQIDFCFPIADANFCFDKMTIPYAAYIYDFQHKKLNHLFTGIEIENRNNSFSTILSRARNTVVNAEEVKKDAELYFSDSISHIYALPFSPLCDIRWLDIAEENNYGDYFMISNQFWKHKDHLCAFEALEKLYVDGYRDIRLICTGKMEDFRFPNYIGEINEKICHLKCKDNITFLGYIEKDKQISLMKNSIAVIQPTHFEGGPGGGSVFNALSLGVPCIVSDIPVNKEIGPEYDVTFFKTGDSDDLKDKMEKLIRRGRRKIEKQELLKRRDEIVSNYSNFLYDMIDEIIKDFNRKEMK